MICGGSMETKKIEIAHMDRASQIISFDGLERGNCSFTDLDGVCEINNEHLVIVEAKMEGKEIPIAQRLLMERLTDWAPIDGVSFVVEHDTNAGEIVRLADCLVREFRLSKKDWVKVIQPKRKPLGTYLVTLEKKWKTRKLIDTYEHKFSYCGYE